MQGAQAESKSKGYGYFLRSMWPLFGLSWTICQWNAFRCIEWTNAARRRKFDKLFNTRTKRVQHYQFMHLDFVLPFFFVVVVGISCVCCNCVCCLINVVLELYSFVMSSSFFCKRFVEVQCRIRWIELNRGLVWWHYYFYLLCTAKYSRWMFQLQPKERQATIFTYYSWLYSVSYFCFSLCVALKCNGKQKQQWTTYRTSVAQLKVKSNESVHERQWRKGRVAIMAECSLRVLCWRWPLAIAHFTAYCTIWLCKVSTSIK